MPCAFQCMLEKVAHELADLSRIAEELQEVLPAVLDPAAPAARQVGFPSSAPEAGLGRDVRRAPADAVVVAVQSLDYLTQSLAYLSEFLVLAAEQAPESGADFSAALQTIGLTELAARLGGRAASAHVGGELELFEAG